MTDEIVNYLQSKAAILVVLVVMAALYFLRKLYRFSKHGRGYSTKDKQDIRDNARRRL